MNQAEVIQAQIEGTSDAIKLALWGFGNGGVANMDLARLLISKRMGLRIAAGERTVKLKAPVVHILDDDVVQFVTFRKEARRQSAAVAASPHAASDQDFVDAISQFPECI